MFKVLATLLALPIVAVVLYASLIVSPLTTVVFVVCAMTALIVHIATCKPE